MTLPGDPRDVWAVTTTARGGEAQWNEREVWRWGRRLYLTVVSLAVLDERRALVVRLGLELVHGNGLGPGTARRHVV